MLTLLLAAALTAATPPPATTAVPYNLDEIAKDMPLVCEAHFIEEQKIKIVGLTGHKAQVIDVFADKGKLSPEMKAQVQGFCAFFDLGASYIIDQINAQPKTGPNGIHPMRKGDRNASLPFPR